MAWYWMVLICVAIVVLIYFVLSYIASRRLSEEMLKPRGANHRSFEQVRREQTELGHVDYEAYDRMEKEPFLLHGKGADIPGEFIPALVPPAPGERPKCLIRVHGHSQNRLMSVRFISMFQSLGYAAAIYDQRAFGESTCDTCTLGYREKYDLSAVITWVKERLGENTIIGVHGESLGGITAMEALGVDDRIDFVIEDGGPTDFYHGAIFGLKRHAHLPSFPAIQMMDRRIKRRYGFGLKDVSPIKQVAKTDVPVMFIHGTADELVPVEMCPELYHAAKNPLSRMELFEGANHCQGHACEPERYEKVVQQFVREVEASLKH